MVNYWGFGAIYCIKYFWVKGGKFWLKCTVEVEFSGQIVSVDCGSHYKTTTRTVITEQADGRSWHANEHAMMRPLQRRTPIIHAAQPINIAPSPFLSTGNVVCITWNKPDLADQTR